MARSKRRGERQERTAKVFVPARTVVAGRYGYDVRHRQIENVI